MPDHLAAITADTEGRAHRNPCSTRSEPSLHLTAWPRLGRPRIPTKWCRGPRSVFEPHGAADKANRRPRSVPRLASCRGGAHGHYMRITQPRALVAVDVNIPAATTSPGRRPQGRIQRWSARCRARAPRIKGPSAGRSRSTSAPMPKERSGPVKGRVPPCLPARHGAEGGCSAGLDARSSHFENPSQPRPATASQRRSGRTA